MICVKKKKKTGQLSESIYFNSKKQTTKLSLQRYLPFESNKFPHPHLSRFFAPLGGQFWDALQSPLLTALIIAFKISIRVIWVILLKSVKTKKCQTAQDQLSKGLFQYGNILLGQKLPNAQSIVSSCIVVVKSSICAVVAIVPSHTLSEAYTAGSPCRLVDSVVVMMSITLEITINITLAF